MSTSWIPPQFGYGGPRRWGGPDPNMRVSDAERTEMADVLSKHYAEGRLDESEFRVRLDKAISAKTRGDLSGLLSDLPPLHPEVQRPKHILVRKIWWVMCAVTILALALAFFSFLTPPHFPWTLVVIVLVILWFRRGHFAMAPSPSPRPELLSQLLTGELRQPGRGGCEHLVGKR